MPVSEAIFMQSTYSQDNPSSRYRALVQQYQTLHSQGSPEQGIVPSDMFPGQSLLEHVAPILRVVANYANYAIAAMKM